MGKALARVKEFQSGRQIGAGYRLVQPISAGADGDVFRGLAELPDGGFQEVAIKQMRLTSASIHRHAQQEVLLVFHARKCYAEEVGNAAAPGHPNLVAYLEWFAGAGGVEREVCLVMERCEFSLADMVYAAAGVRAQYERKLADAQRKPGAQAQNGPDVAMFKFTEREIAKVMCHLLAALAFLNRHGVVHRDVKCENILWVTSDPEGLYKLADFGTAALLSESDGQGGLRAENCGTLWTMAPEVLERRAHGPACDVWSLGVVLFELAVLDKPFLSKNLLAYRSSQEAAAGGKFWAAMFDSLGGAGSSSSSGGKNSAPTSPSSAGAGARGSVARGDPAGPKPALPSRSASTPSLPLVRAAGGRRPTPAARPSKGGLGGGGTGAGPGSQLPPLPHAATTPACVLQAAISRPSTPGGERPPAPVSQRSAFLKRRCGNRWFYSGELRAVVFEDMLEEDPAKRPTAAGLLQSGPVQSMLTLYGWSAASAPDAAAPTPAPAPFRPPEEASQVVSLTGGVYVQALAQVTGENFRLAVRVNGAAQA